MVESRKAVRADRPVVVSGFTVLPVYEQVSWCRSRRGGISFSGVKRPVAVIAGSAAGWRVFRSSGVEMTFEEFRREYPDVRMP
jgi:hypothetical protein